jgi:carboxymethylenebutenolidase
MCHSHDSRPPGPPNPGDVAEHGALELRAGDDNLFNAYRAVPAVPNGSNVVILPDIRGLHPFYADLATRFAEAGFTTVALDYFGRTAGVGDRDDEFDWEPHVPQVRPGHVDTDVAAVVHELREINDGPTFVVGFCFGGGHSWRLAASELPVDGVIGFYGIPSFAQGVLGDFTKPALFLVAGADHVTPREEFEGMSARLTELGREHEMHVYEGAPHSFFDRSHAEWQEACADAWRRILDFTEKHSKKHMVQAVR